MSASPDRTPSEFNPVELIARKRDGAALAAEEIGELIRGYVAGDVKDHQMAALAMAICLRGMNAAETLALTQEMLASGGTLPAADRSRRVDKHSTGGVGDKTSFVLAPLLACCDLEVPMISGRGLGTTGGTLDKLESIPGVRTELSAAEVSRVLDRVGCVITSATADLVPADRKLYALRDVTGTVPSQALITASIMSKKLAEGLSALVLDVKVGSGAFMKTVDAARALAASMVAVGNQMNVQTTALVTSMDQPNGRLAGHAVEIDESLEVLAGGGPADLRELVLALAAEILVMKQRAPTLEEARHMLADHLDSGRAHERFAAMIAAQGGRLDAPRPRAASWTLRAARGGFVRAIDTGHLGLALLEMGGGRKQLGDRIDHSVGLEMLVRIGDAVAPGQPLVNIFAAEAARARGVGLIENAIEISEDPSTPVPLVIDRIRAADAGGTQALGDSGALGPAVRLDSDQPAAKPDVSAEDRRRLGEAALAAARHAHAPYSGFRVGAAALAESGQVYVGTNVENASFGLTICAERVALAAAVAAGERAFRMLAVASAGGAAPCGACRQFAAEFAPDLPVLLVDCDGHRKPHIVSLAELLPGQFQLPRNCK